MLLWLYQGKYKWYDYLWWTGICCPDIWGVFLDSTTRSPQTIPLRNQQRENAKPLWIKLHVTSLSHNSGPWYYVSLCQRVIVHPLILNAWLPTGHYEISSALQLSSMSLEALNVSLLQQAGLTFVPRSSPMPPGSPTVRRPKSRDLKPANPPHWWHLSCDIPPSPIHTGSKAAEKEGAARAWDQGLASSVAQ